MRTLQIDWIEKMTGAEVQNRAVPSLVCGPREPHPCLRATHRQARQVKILLDSGITVTCKKQ